MDFSYRAYNNGNNQKTDNWDLRLHEIEEKELL